MQIMAEMDPVFCWQRLRYLHDCYTINEPFPSLKACEKGALDIDSKTAWRSAIARSE